MRAGAMHHWQPGFYQREPPTDPGGPMPPYLASLPFRRLGVPGSETPSLRRGLWGECEDARSGSSQGGPGQGRGLNGEGEE